MFVEVPIFREKFLLKEECWAGVSKARNGQAPI